MAKGVTGAPFNRQPRGLLDFLGIKSFGEYPQTMGNEYRPTLDLLPWLQAVDQTYCTLTSSSSPIAAPGLAAFTTLRWTSSGPVALPTAGGNITVPNDEYWLVMRYLVGWTMTAAASQIVDIAPSMYIPNVADDFVLPCNQLGNKQSGTIVAGGAAVVTEPIFFPPGSAPTVTVMRVEISANATFFGRLALHRFRV